MNRRRTAAKARATAAATKQQREAGSQLTKHVVIGTVVLAALLFFGTTALSLLLLTGAEQRPASGAASDPSSSRHRRGLGGASLLRGGKGSAARVNPHVVAFYYPWYRTPSHDGAYRHWNHELLPHWTEEVNRRFGLVSPSSSRSDNNDNKARAKNPHHDPDAHGIGDIGSTYYPALGPYSSLNRTVLSTHMSQLRDAGVGVVSVSWYPPHTLDVGQPTSHALDVDSTIPSILDAAAQYGLRVSLHLEPYEGRNASNAIEVMGVACHKYGRHEAYHRIEGRPVFYVYDSYQTDAAEWGEAIRKFGLDLSGGAAAAAATEQGRRWVGLRPGRNDLGYGDGNDGDAILRPYLYMLWVERKHETYLDVGGFDGAYTYFASEGMVWGSTPSSWRYMASACHTRDKSLSVSVGPGYDDLAVRPWNGGATKDREGGQYYRRMVRRAMDSGCDEITITSWNEWHEGTQIEPAAGGIETAGIRRSIGGHGAGGGRGGNAYFPSYEDGPSMYVDLTRRMLRDWKPGLGGKRQTLQ